MNALVIGALGQADRHAVGQRSARGDVVTAPSATVEACDGVPDAAVPPPNHFAACLFGPLVFRHVFEDKGRRVAYLFASAWIV
jgi:hypothetical protein